MNRREKLEVMLDVKGGPWLKKWEQDVDLSGAIQRLQGVNIALVRLVYGKTVSRGSIVAPIAVESFVLGGAVGSERSFYRDMAKLNKEGIVLKFPWLVHGLKTVTYYGLGLGRILMNDRNLSMREVVEKAKERSGEVQKRRRLKDRALTAYALMQEWNFAAINAGYRKPTWTKKDAGMLKNWLYEMSSSDYSQKEIIEIVEAVVDRWSEMRRRKKWKNTRIDPRVETPTFKAFYPLRHEIVDFIHGTEKVEEKVRPKEGGDEWTWKG